ncbi:ABC transporter substrate-binding protein [Naasia sp. SYSU D00948]|uniref:ABC transporter substrate-binding protein n=1 Tax=Naasia sp. SYSU D00948 TaxID=2817379 RepID=UPI001FEF792E|nr:extracellular solute-binding protein [Naasia sp. SYSU D00948]
MRTAAVTLAAGTLALTGCAGGGGGGGGGEGGGDVTLTWWHNGTQGVLKEYWQSVADAFEEENPGVKVEIQVTQNEELQRTKIPNALRSNNPPDLFQQWGGGEMAAQVEAGRLLDISDDVEEELDSIGGKAAGWQFEGQTYGLPYSMGIEGFWYNKAMFEQAGITTPPATMDELNDAVSKLKAAGITPIAVGAADKWPAAHYWYNFALRSCSQETLEQASAEFDFSDPCFEEAGEHLQSFIETEPFQEGFLATSAQQGAGSSAGMLANGQAAMELMGHWNPGVMAGLTESGEGLGENLGWFNFPGVEGGEGDPKAALGGGDGFSCSWQAPPECVDLLKFVVNVENQRAFAETQTGLPVAEGSEDAVTDPTMQTLLEGRDSAPYVQLWLDTTFGPTVGGAMNDAIANMFAGQAQPGDIVKAMTDAAATL